MNKMTLYMDGKEVGQVHGVEARLCLEIAQRQARGIHKYGQTLEDNPALLIERVQHMKEEQLDGAAYAQWVIDRLEGK